METKPLLYGLIGFFIGGLLVSVAATTFDKPQSSSNTQEMSMSDMSSALSGKSGDDYDKEFLRGMIAHHEGALDMANQSADNAKHQEIKALSEEIITSQQREINTMKQWYEQWGYGAIPEGHSH